MGLREVLLERRVFTVERERRPERFVVLFPRYEVDRRRAYAMIGLRGLGRG